MGEEITEKSSIHKESVPNEIDRLRREARLRVGSLKYADGVYNFSQKLKKQHPDVLKYRCYHQLVGSTPWEDVIEGDFEGEDSIIEFLKSLK